MSSIFTRNHSTLIFAIMIGAVAASNARAECTTRWQPVGQIPGVARDDPSNFPPLVVSLGSWDADGAGPMPTKAIFAGRFEIAGNTLANGIAAWDGTSWSPLGSGIPTGQYGYAITTFNGELIVGGNFSYIGGFGGQAIGRWNGSNWYTVGSGIASANAQIFALTVFNGELIAGGDFSSIGGTAANNIARWNGSSWQTLGAGTNLSVNALYVFNNDLYAGGAFTQAGGNSTNRIAKWNGTTWSAVGAGFNNPVVALTEFGGELYAGGLFSLADGNPASRIARWNGSAWQSLGLGTNNTVYCLTNYGGLLFVGGDFNTVDGNSVKGVATWNGSTWSAVGSNSPGYVRGFASFQGQLLVGGSFGLAGTEAAHHVARWDNSAWHALTENPFSKPHVFAHYNGDLIIGGTFTSYGGVTANNIVRLDKSNGWTPLGSGTNGTATVVIEQGSDLIVAGTFTSAGGVPASRIARWDGSSWHALGAGIENGLVFDLAVVDGILYAGGSFMTAGGSPANRVAAWNGSAWSAAGSGVDDSVAALASYNGELYVCGPFRNAGGATANKIARWNGSAWNTVSGGIIIPVVGDTPVVSDLEVWNNELYVAGGFNGATNTGLGEVGSTNIVKWNGTQWVPFNTPVLMGCYNMSCPTFPLRLLATDNELYVGGDFVQFENPTYPAFVAKTNGGPWQSLDSGLNGLVSRLGFHQGQLLIAGSFTTVGGQGTNGFARLGQAVPTISPVVTGGCPPSQITLSVSECPPGPFTYQWRKNGVNLSDGGNISGSQSSSLTLSPVSVADDGAYDALVTGSFGLVESEPFSLVIDQFAPQIISQPSTTAACLNAPLNLQVAATGGTLSYQWRKNSVNLINGGRISGATSSSLTITPSQLADSDTYDVLVTNLCDTTPSDIVSVSVQSHPQFNSQPQSASACANDSIVMSVTASAVAPVSYQWRKNGLNISNTAPFSGANTNTLTINPVSELEVGNYDCIVTDACNFAISAEAALGVANSLPSLVFGPDPVDLCAGQYTSLAAFATSSPSPTYQWRKDGDPIDGATNSFLEFLEAAATDTGQYDVVISNGCGDIIPAAVQLNVFATATADGNLDTNANGLDIPGLLDALLNWDFVTFSAPYCAYDMNADAYVDNSDIPGVVAIILGS